MRWKKKLDIDDQCEDILSRGDLRMKAVMYGAGNIGRGFIGQLFYKSGYEVVFIDVNENMIEEINRRGSYPVTILGTATVHEEMVEGAHCVNGMDEEAVAQAISSADILATAVGVNVLPRIAKNLAKGIEKRFLLGNNKPLNIIICENKIGADTYIKELVLQHLPSDMVAWMEENIGLVEASIGRMVPLQTPQMQNGDILRVCVESYDLLPVDKDAFRGEIPHIHNMVPFSPFAFYIERKLYIHNMGHAMTAYLGSLKGYQFIDEAIADPAIFQCVQSAMMQSGLALSMRHKVDFVEIKEHIENLLERFANKRLGDTPQRVGGDLMRKLSREDRLVGALLCCEGEAVEPTYICLAIAAAMLFEDKGFAFSDPLEILHKVCKIEKGKWHDLILRCYLELKTGMDICDMQGLARQDIKE